MADTKLVNLSSTTPALADLVYIVDVSDSTDDPTGSSRKTTIQSAFDSLGVPYSNGGASIVENSDGSISIITASGKKLSIFSGGSTGAVILLNDTSGTRQVCRLQFQRNGTFKWQLGTDLNSNDGNNFFVFDQATGSSRILIASGGNTELDGGHLVITTDNTYDIGASGATRPRSVYVGTSVVLDSAGKLAWDTDAFLQRDGAGILSQRNGANAQAHRVYNTYTDASNGEWGALRWNGNVLEVGANANGTGTVRDVNLVGVHVNVNTTTGLATLDVGGTIRSGGGGFFLWRNLTDFSARRNWAWQSESQTTGDVCLIESSANNNAPSVPRFQILSGGAVVVLGPYADLQSTAWIYGHPGKKRLSANATNATATLSSGVLSDLTVTLVAGRKYTGRCVLIANNSTGAEGLQYDFNGGTATMTNFQATAEEAPIGATLGTTNSTALGTALTNTVVSTSDTVYAVNITLVCNAGGTFIPRIAENSAHVSGTATVKLGSYLWLEDTP